MAFTQRARFRSNCPKCKTPILVGQDICRTGSSNSLGWVHAHCYSPEDEKHSGAGTEGSHGGEHLEPEGEQQLSRRGDKGEDGQGQGQPEGQGQGQGADEDRVREIAREEDASEASRERTTKIVQETLEAMEFEHMAQRRSLEVKVQDAPTITVDLAHDALPDVLLLAANRINVLLVGPSGCGKTFLSRQVAEALDLEFSTISCTSGMSEGQLLGRLLPTGEGGRFEYHSAPFVERFEKGGVFLLDEVDAADENTMLTLNQGLANGVLPLPHRTHAPVAVRHPDFVCIAAANTFGTGADRVYVGRNQLDDATLDRFRVGTVEVDYSKEIEKQLCPNDEILRWLWGVRDKASKARLRRVISTRFLEQAYIMSQAGWALSRIQKALFSGWSMEEKEAVK